MRVLMFCGHFRPVVGGAERQAEILARALLRQGCSVEVLTPRYEAEWPEREDADGLAIRRFPLFDVNRRFPRLRGMGLPNLALGRRDVRRAVRSHVPQFDLLHAHVASPILALAVGAAHECGRPVLCKIACGGEGFDFKKLAGATSLLGPRLVRRLITEVDRWVAISEEVGDDLRRAGVAEARIRSIPNGIELASGAARKRSGPLRRFLCMGRLVKFDLASLLTAFDALAKELPDLELRIAGVGDADAVRRRLLALPAARDRVAVVGFSPSERELRWADALVHPSLAEGMSNTLLEAMRAGVPCAASAIAPNRELLGEGEAGLLFPAGDPGALAAAVRRFAREPDLAPALAAAARSRVERIYAIDAVASRYVALYEDVLESWRRREPAAP